MVTCPMRSRAFLGLLSLLLACAAQAQSPASEGLIEKLLSVNLDAGARQEGVLSVKAPAGEPTHLAVILPGYPSVLRPRVEGDAVVLSRLNGNFLVRARRHLAAAPLALLMVDCRSDSGDECRDGYQSSPQRHADVLRLVQAARRELPSVRSVWLVGTSMGTISSSFMARYGAADFEGAIHTASITEPARSYRSLIDFDYGATRIRQVFVHHRDDPCVVTTYASARAIATRYKIPLVTVVGGSDFRGRPCDAFTEHGFRGVEAQVMREIRQIILTGEPGTLEVR